MMGERLKNKLFALTIYQLQRGMSSTRMAIVVRFGKIPGMSSKVCNLFLNVLIVVCLFRKLVLIYTKKFF